MEYKIDAENQIVGRLAVKVALLLRGKTAPDFAMNTQSGNRVVVFNMDKIRVTGRKEEKKLYRHHSGYPGGLKEEHLAHMRARDSRIILRHAVMGMLPKNRLRAKFIRNLILHKGTIA